MGALKSSDIKMKEDLIMNTFDNLVKKAQEESIRMTPEEREKDEELLIEMDREMLEEAEDEEILI